jgi:pSer/pThr/pTyr-binding forkhead associated (FHA) protein
MTAVLFLLRAAILVLLWAFVIAAIVAVRHDVFGSRRAAPAGTGGRTAPPRAKEKPAAPRKKTRGLPRQVVVVEGQLAGQTFPLSDAPVTIGRADDSTITLTDDYASTRHARLVPRGDEWVLEDLGSTNGTYIDRDRVTSATPVTSGVRIRIGKTVLELRP